MSLPSSYIRSNNIQFLCVNKEKHGQKILLDAVNDLRFSRRICWRSKFFEMWNPYPSASSGWRFEGIWNIGMYLPNDRA